MTDAESACPDVVKIATHVPMSREMLKDYSDMQEAMSHPVSREDWEAWMAAPDDENPFDCEPFEPDHDLVVKLAEWLGDRPKGEAFMVTAYGALIHLYDLGIELPTAHTEC